MSSFTVDVGRFLTDIQRRWDRLGPAERMRLLKGAGLLVMGPPMTLTGSAHFLGGHGAHMQAVQQALQESIPLTTRLLKQQLAEFELDSLWPLLQKFAIEAGSYIGGGALVGAAVGSAPGALLGAKVGAWVYQAVGVAELVVDLPDLCSQVAGPYCSGFNSAWALGETALQRDPIQQSLHRAKAAREFATGHALLVTALLATLALYLGRNAARRTPLFTALANGRLGKDFAKWIERHQAQMIQSPKLKPRKTLAQQVQEEEARLLARAKAGQPRAGEDRPASNRAEPVQEAEEAPAARQEENGQAKSLSGEGDNNPPRLPKKRSFKAGQDQIHFEKHGQEIATTLGEPSYTLGQYVDDANAVIRNGNFVPELNGYVGVAGGQGSAKGMFVGIDRATGDITTMHLKPVSFFQQKAPSLGWHAKPKTELTDLIGPKPDLGWKAPYRLPGE